MSNMMHVKAKSLRLVIDRFRLESLRSDSMLEQYEAIMENTTAPIDKERWRMDMEVLRTQNRKTRERVRTRLAQLERVLEQDEKVNGWKGENRMVEVY